MEKLNKLVKGWSKVRWSFPFTTWDQDTCQKQFWRHWLDCWTSFGLHSSTCSWLVLVSHPFPPAVITSFLISYANGRFLELDSPWPLFSLVDLPEGRWSWSTLENRGVKSIIWWQSCTFKGGDVLQWGFCTKTAGVELPAAQAAVAELSWPVLTTGGNYPHAPSYLQFPKPFSSKIARLLLTFAFDLSAFTHLLQPSALSWLKLWFCS